MASYSLILDTKFKPFTYDELIKTPLMETQVHQALEEAYGELARKTSVWEEMADEQSDPYAYRLYKTYANDLDNKANQLLEHGLDISSRKGMLDMQSRYSKEIAPIENAYKRREELAAEQRKAMMSNPTMMYQRYARDMSLDDFIRDPSADYGASYSGALLTQQVATKAAALSKELKEPGERGQKARIALEQLLPYQYRTLEKNGFDSQEVLKAIMQDSDASPILLNLVDSTLASSGIYNWADEDTKRRARAYANEGLWQAVGTSKYNYMTDQAGLTKLQYDLQLRNRRQAMIDKAILKGALGGNGGKTDEELLTEIAKGAHTFIGDVNGSSTRAAYSVLNDLFDKTGTSVNMEYFGSMSESNRNKRRGKSINPMEVYRQADEINHHIISDGDLNGKKAWIVKSGTKEEAGYYLPVEMVDLFNEYAKLHPDDPKLKSIKRLRPSSSTKDGYTKVANVKNANWIRDIASEMFAEKRIEELKKRHGISKILTKEQYDKLQELGFENLQADYNGPLKYGSDINAAIKGTIDNSVKAKSYYSTLMSDYSMVEDRILPFLKNAEINDTFEGLVYSIDKNGKKKEVVDYEDFTLGSKDKTNNKVYLSDIAYSAQQPDMILITLSDGNQYYIDPEAWDSSVKKLIDVANEAIKDGADKTEVAQNTTAALVGKINAFNQNKSKTSSKFDDVYPTNDDIDFDDF